MVRYWSHIVLALIASVVIVLTVAVDAQSQTTPTKELTATISGKVTIKDKGVSGVVVGLRAEDQAYRPRPTIYRAVTDVNGEYQITNVPAGSYRVIPVAPAFVMPEDGGKALLVDKGETIEHVDFVLVRGGVITGKVVDPDGRPVIEEEVTAAPVPVRNRMGYQPWGTRTDDRGVYRMFGIPPGSYKVVAGQAEENSYPGRMRASYKRTYHPAAVDDREATVIEVSEGSEAKDVDITLSRALTTYRASGRILDRDTGQPLPNVRYGLTRFINTYNTSSWDNGATTNARGEFKFDGLVPGQYTVSLGSGPDSDWRAEVTRFEVVDQDVKDLVVRAKKGSSLSGVVVLEGTEDKTVRERLRGTGLTAATISESGSDRPTSSWTNLAPDGSFRMSGVQPGLVTFYFPSANSFRVVRVEYNGVVQPRGIEVKDGQQVTGVRIVVNYGNASIRGVISIENGTLPQNGRYFVQLRRTNDGEPNKVMSSDPSPQVDARGQFLVEGLLPGVYELHAGVYVPGSQSVTLEKKQEVVVTANTPTNVNVTLDLKSATPRP